MAIYTGRGLVVKRPGVLSKVQMLNLILGVGVFSLLPNCAGIQEERWKQIEFEMTYDPEADQDGGEQARCLRGCSESLVPSLFWQNRHLRLQGRHLSTKIGT